MPFLAERSYSASPSQPLRATAAAFACCRGENGVMIDVIGTDAGAPGSLAHALQALVQEADLIAAPQRMRPALDRWLEDSLPQGAWPATIRSPSARP